MSVTIRDVARLAGVSASTVSRVLNGKGAISEETKNEYSTRWMSCDTCQTTLRAALPAAARAPSHW